MVDNALLFFAGFFFIWIGSGIIVSSADHISKSLKLSSFALSFFILGILTSIPEFALGVSSIASDDSEIIVGTLLGGIVVLFLFVIPILAVLGNGIKMTNEFDRKRMISSLFVVTLPSFFILDHKISPLEGVIMMVAYIILLLFIQSKKGILSHTSAQALANKTFSLIDTAKIMGGVSLVFLASSVVVAQTTYFSQEFAISPFYISLIILSIGTNLPELSLSIRSVLKGKKDVAFGDYLGSAAANTFLMGMFTVIERGNIVTANQFYIVYLFTVIAVCFFYFFARSDEKITRSEGMILLLFYVLFIIFELIR